jgi:hypothetical protein
MKLQAATLLLAMQLVSCGAQISLGGKERVGEGILSDKATNYTILASRSSKLSPSVSGEVIAYIDDHINMTAKFDFYVWNKYASSNEIVIMAVCPTNNTDVAECAAVAQYNDEPCGSASICPFEAGTKKFEVTADCEGISSELPSCSFTCATFESDGAAFDTCFTSSVDASPTTAPAGPTSFAPHTKLSTFQALPFIVVGGAMWMIWCV